MTSLPPGPRTESSPRGPLSATRPLAVAASVAIAVAALSRVATVLLYVRAYYIRATGSSASGGTAAVRDALDAAAVLGIVTPVLLAAAGVVFLVWLYRARSHADLLASAPLRWGRGWAVGAWFVPVGNLVLPPLVVADLARATDPVVSRGARAGGISGRHVMVIVAWWGCVLAAWLFNVLAAAFNNGAASASDPGGALAGVVGVAMAHTVEAVLDLTAAGLILLIMLRISTRLDERRGLAAAGWPLMPASVPVPPVDLTAPSPARFPGGTADVVGTGPTGPLGDDRAVGNSKRRLPVGLGTLAVLGVLVVALVVAVTVWATSGSGGSEGPVPAPPPGREISAVQAGGRLAQVVASPDVGRAYVADHTGHRIVVVGRGASSPTGVISLPGEPDGLAISPDGAHLFVTVKRSVLVIDTVSTRVQRTLELPDWGYNLAVTPDGRTLLVSRLSDPEQLLIVNVASGRLSGALPCPRCEWVTSASDGRTAYAFSDSGAAALLVIDVPTRAVTRTVPIDAGTGAIDANAIIASPDGMVYLAGRHAVTVVDPVRGSSRALPVGELAGGDVRTVATTAGGRRIVVARQSALYVLDAVSGAVLQHIPLSSDPDGGMAVSRDGRTVYLSTPNGSTITVDLGDA